MVKLYIGTLGLSFSKDESFYKEDTDKLSKYSTVFNSICISSTFFGSVAINTYKEWSEKVGASFKFIVTAPKAVTFSKDKIIIKRAWSSFWRGCDILNNAKKLAYVLLEFPTTFSYTPSNLKRIEWYLKKLSAPSLAFELKNSSWWEDDAVQSLRSLFNQYQNIQTTIVLSCLENRIVDAGWAGNMYSTSFKQVKSRPLIGSGSPVVKLYGSLGCEIGSYDEKIENVVGFIESLPPTQSVYCVFGNTKSTYCHPLPPVIIEMIIIWPHLKELPYYLEEDLPSCLHDAIQLKEAWKYRKIPKDENGFVKLTTV